MMRRVWLILAAVLLISSIVASALLLRPSVVGNEAQGSGVYFGVTFGSDKASDAKLLIDKVKDYTNLFIVASYPVATNETALNEVCSYAINKGLNIIVYFGFVSHVIYPWQITWVENAKQTWGDKFLGIYIFDEPGGKQIDLGAWNNETSTFANVTSYDQAADTYISSVSSSQSMKDLKANGIKAFTSDYALYWFDYKAGFDVVFTELGDTNGMSKLQAISLCRGAADVQGKEWGAIITWAYTSPPYLENGIAILQDMLTAYSAGAKYIVVFNYPTYPASNPYGVLTEDQFNAMKDFWSQIHSTQDGLRGAANAQVALVLPENYGSALRTPIDRVWLWPADSLTAPIWSKMDQLIKTYGARLDIIYNDGTVNLEKYSHIYYWNSTNTT